jgi:outer membrane protein assembly factor BamD
MRFIFIKFLFIGCLSVSLSGCSSLGDLFSGDDKQLEDEYANWTIDKFRQEAKKAVDDGAFDRGIKIYEALESRYPFGESSAQTQLDVAYAYFKNNDPESALAAAERFIKANPRDASVDYAYYLKGLVNYNRDMSFIDRFLPSDTSQRDTTSANTAYNNFDELVRKFPKSKYVPDAWQRMISLKNNIAMHEVHVARYYLKRKAYVAAANRASLVIEKYQRTPAVPYALQVMQDAYTQLGLKELANDAGRVYQQNYPSGPPVAEQQNATLSHRFWDFIALDK